VDAVVERNGLPITDPVPVITPDQARTVIEQERQARQKAIEQKFNNFCKDNKCQVGFVGLLFQEGRFIPQWQLVLTD